MSFENRFTMPRLLCGCLIICGMSNPWVAAQDLTAKQPVSVMSSSLEKVQPTTVAINLERDRLYKELADEFSTFDRLGYLVRRVSHLVKPSVIHIEAHKVEQRGSIR